MTPLKIGIEIDADTDFNLMIGIFGINGPVDITGYDFLGEIRSTTDPESLLVAEFEFSIQDQITNKGMVKMSLPRTTDEAITLSVATPLSQLRQKTRFLFDVKMMDSVGNVSRILEGIAYVSPQATTEEFT